MIGHEYVAVPDISMHFEDAADEVTINRGMEEHRRRHDQASGTVEDHAAEVSRLPDDGGIAGAIEMIMHLLDQAGDLVAQHLDSDGVDGGRCGHAQRSRDRKSTRLNSSHLGISYAVFCLKKKTQKTRIIRFRS